MKPKRLLWRGGLEAGRAVVFTAAFVLTIGLAGCGEREGAAPYAGLFPQPAAMEHVIGAGDVALYADETLYDFLNGGAELYFDYAIVAAASREYILPEDSGVEASIYDMGSPHNAFGIYSIFRYPGADLVSIGNEAIRTPATLDFWKGKYYCKLFAFGTSGAAAAAMDEIARHLADRIAAGGSEPELLGRLPQTLRIAGSEKYFRGHLGLNNIRYVDSENLFGLGDGTEGVTAGYREADGEYTGYIIAYPDRETARGAFERYTAFLSGKARESSQNGVRTFVLEGGEVEYIAREGRYIAGVWDAEPGEHPGFIESAFAALAGED
jgi:hypothetical protein